LAARGACPSIRQPATPECISERGSRAGTDKVVTAFLEGMRAHGYVEGRDFEIVRIEQSNSFAAGGVRMKIKTHSGGRIQTRIDREQVFERRGFPTFAPIFKVVGDEV
jgi:hypothetical protein